MWGPVLAGPTPISSPFETRTLWNFQRRLDFRPPCSDKPRAHVVYAGDAIDQDRLLRLEVAGEEYCRSAAGDPNGGHPHVALMDAPAAELRAYGAVTAQVPPALMERVGCEFQNTIPVPKRVGVGVVRSTGPPINCSCVYSVIDDAYTHRYPGAACGSAAVPGHSAVGGS